jgi:sugar lactone lactonase YvrE
MRQLGFFGAALASALLGTACSGGGASSVSSLPAPVGGPPRQGVTLAQVDPGSQVFLDPDAGRAYPVIKIFITSSVQNAGSVTAYNRSGTQVTPTITTDLDFPQLLAVDPSGKIFVANASETTFGGKVTTYKKSGVETTPRIANIADLPTGIAVDMTGKIYVATVANDLIQTYTKNGAPTTPTIQNQGLSFPYGIAVDRSGKIYAANSGGGGASTVTTYKPDGTPTTPVITGFGQALGVAVDEAGKIYVTDGKNNTLTTYNPDGTPTTPTITGLHGPFGVAVDGAGNIYIVNDANSTLTTYKKDGTPTTPTITTTLSNIEGVALSQTTTIGIRLNGEMSIIDPKYGFELGYAVGTVSTLTQTISLGMDQSVEFKNVDTIPHTAAFLGNATAHNAPWPSTFTGGTVQSPAGTAVSKTGWTTGNLAPNQISQLYSTGLPGFYMIGCQYHYVPDKLRTVIVVH